MKPYQKAFTLLELLVVITIIGILASIVVVSMSDSTDSAEIAKRKSYAQQTHALLGHEAVLDLNFNENDYDTCPDGKDACDASGYNNNGTIYNDGAAYVSSPVDGYALSFNGTSDYINLGNPASLKITGDLTFSSWLKPTTVAPTYQGILPDLGSGAIDRNFQTYLQGSRMYFAHGNGTGSWSYQTATGVVIADEMHFYVWVVNGTSLSFWKDGTKIGATVAMSNAVVVPAGAGDKHIGGRLTSEMFSGIIEDVRIYSEALPSTEIQKHYVQGLEKLLSNQDITKAEYDRRMEEFNRSLALKRF
jgi:prepilin-type N-terminal cleavage/methylation domain-containing protein